MSNEPKSPLIGHHPIQLTQISSTNTFLVDLLSKSTPPEGTAVLADIQTEGRGQIGSQWLSEPGKNLLCSILLYPDGLHADDQFLLAQITSLAILDALSPEFPGLAIKWPNDIYLEDRKLAGILIQNQWLGSTIRSSVIGIGLNINQRSFDLPDLQPHSLTQFSGMEHDINTIFHRVCHALEIRYHQWKQGQFVHIRSAYQKQLYLLDLPFVFEECKTNRIFIGTIRGVNNLGTLRVEDLSSGRILTFQHKEIKYLCKPSS